MSENHRKATIDVINFSTNLLVGSRDLPGEKMNASFAVPNLWARKRATRMPIEIEEMLLLRLGTDSPRPETAEVTETAGVSIPSANVRAVANSVCIKNK